MRIVKRALAFFAILLLSLVAVTSVSALATSPKVASVNATQNTPLKTESVKQEPETKVSEADKETKQTTESQSVVESESTETKSSLTSSEVESTEKPSEEKEVSDIEDRLKSELSEKGQVELTDHEAKVLDSQGKVVDTLTTDVNGKATSKKLPLGHYQVVEVKAPRQYVLDNKKYEVELTNTGKATPLVEVSKTILNKEVPPTIGTTLTDSEGEKQVDPLQEVVLKDVVKVAGAIVGKFYDLVGTLKDVETGEDLLYNGKKVTASTRVQAKTKDFFAELFFKFDARSLKGKKVVAFEDLYTNGRHVASEAKLDNPSQTVRIRNPKIHTTATINGKKEVEAGQPYTVEDVVQYEDFSPGKYYRLSGLAAYPDTKELIRINGSIPKGTVTFKAESENGKVTVPIYFESTEHLSGKSAVILEEAERLLVSKDATDDEVKKAKGESVAEHKDYKDYGQTVTFTPPTPPVTPPTPPTPPHTPELPKTGESTNAFILVGGLLLMLGMFVLPKRKEV